MNGKEIIKSKIAPAPIGPYSQAVLIDRFLFVSGQVALDAEGNLHNQNIEEETHQVMKNIKAILAETGMDFPHVVKASIFVKDMNNFQAINQVYGSYFTKNHPARETVEVSRLPKDANLEISIIAVKNPSDYVS